MIKSRFCLLALFVILASVLLMEWVWTLAAEKTAEPVAKGAAVTVEKTGGRKRIAVIPFEPTGEYRGTPLPGAMAEMLATALVKSRRFDVIERAQLEKILNEQKLAAEGIVDPKTAAKVGKVLGVDYLIGGRITEFGVKEKETGLGQVSKILGATVVDIKKSTARVKLDVRLIEVETAKILLADTGTGEEKLSGVVFIGSDLKDFILGGKFKAREWDESRIGKATRKAIDEVVSKIIVHFLLQGRVLAVVGSNVYIDLGSFHGMKVGEELVVYRLVEIRDEETDEFIWEEKVEIGTIKIVEAREERSKAVVVKMSEAGQIMPTVTVSPGIKKGDIVVPKKLVPEAKKQESK